MEEKRNVKNLVFQGGSVKGVAYIGALKALEVQIDMSKVERVAGTSAGAITAMALALGCNSLLVEELLLDFDFKNILDDAEVGINTNEKLLKSVEKHEQGKGMFFSKIPAKTVKIPLISRIQNQYGIYEGEYFRLWAEELIQKQVKAITNGKHDGIHLTFAELHTLSKEYPAFKDLYVVGVNLNTGKKAIFSYDNSDFCDVIISDAVRLSMSIPIIFKPHHVYYKINGKRLVDAERHFYVDGGMYENYPIRCFDKLEYYSQKDTIQNSSSIFFNPETLGFRLISQKRKDYFEGITTEPEALQINGMLGFGKAIIQGLMAKQEDDHSLVSEDKMRSLYIDHLGVSTMAFNLNSVQQKALVESGQYTVEMHFTGKSQISKPSLENNQTIEDEIPPDISEKCRMQ